MNNLVTILTRATFTLVISTVISVGISTTANAHDPSLHVKKAEKADCSKMDHSKMDMKDPVAMAMMKKCMKQAKDAKKAMKGMDHSKMKMDHSKMKKEAKKEMKKTSDNHNDHH